MIPLLLYFYHNPFLLFSEHLRTNFVFVFQAFHQKASDKIKSILFSLAWMWWLDPSTHTNWIYISHHPVILYMLQSNFQQIFFLKYLGSVLLFLFPSVPLLFVELWSLAIILNPTRSSSSRNPHTYLLTYWPTYHTV